MFVYPRNSFTRKIFYLKLDLQTSVSSIGFREFSKIWNQVKLCVAIMFPEFWMPLFFSKFELEPSKNKYDFLLNSVKKRAKSKALNWRIISRTSPRKNGRAKFLCLFIGSRASLSKPYFSIRFFFCLKFIVKITKNQIYRVVLFYTNSLMF